MTPYVQYKTQKHRDRGPPTVWLFQVLKRDALPCCPFETLYEKMCRNPLHVLKTVKNGHLMLN